MPRYRVTVWPNAAGTAPEPVMTFVTRGDQDLFFVKMEGQFTTGDGRTVVVRGLGFIAEELPEGVYR